MKIISMTLNEWSGRLHVTLDDGRTARFKIIDSGSAITLQLSICNHDDFHFVELEEILTQLTQLAQLAHASV